MSAIANPSMELELGRWAWDLKEFLEELPRKVRRGHREQALRQCERIVEGLPEPKPDATWSGAWVKVCASLEELRDALGSGAAKSYVLARYDDAARAYEQWLAARRAASRTGERAAVRLGSLRPLIGARTSFHMISGVVATVAYQALLTRLQAEAILLVLLGVFAALEITRRFSGRWNHFLAGKLFHGIARPREYYKLNSSTLYLVGLALLTPVFSRPAVLTGVLILAFADPAAAWIGRRYGRRKLYQGKTLAGATAFALTGMVVAGAFLLAFYPELPLWRRLLAVALASLAGMVAELFSGRRLDDNLAIPVAAVLAAAAVL